jgi:copper resistance protein B
MKMPALTPALWLLGALLTSPVARAQLPMPATIPAVTAADRAAAFPDLGDMKMSQHMNDDPIQALLLLDRFELQRGQGRDTVVWDFRGWIGGDDNRLTLRSEESRLEALWWHAMSRWWNSMAGLRHDQGDLPVRDWLALGIVGLAPYRITLQATAYLASAGRMALRVESEYDLLLTNRWILQPRVELNAGYRGGLEAGLRLRYEIRRELAPYVGVNWRARAAGASDNELQAVMGLRLWY